MATAKKAAAAATGTAKKKTAAAAPTTQKVTAKKAPAQAAAGAEPASPKAALQDLIQSRAQEKGRRGDRRARGDHPEVHDQETCG
jgi:hypothetical protein